jgi:hypothetical protein
MPMHSTLAFRPHGLPLGLLNQQLWARADVAMSRPRAKHCPIAEKESYKWLSALRKIPVTVKAQTSFLGMV